VESAGRDNDSEIKAAHQFLPELHRFFRVEATEDFFTTIGVHGDEIAHEFFARLVFGVLAPADPDRNQGGDDPDGEVHRTHVISDQ
jgi:hypothetical protein